MTEQERITQKRERMKAYMRKYRLTHPEYRERELIRRAKSVLNKAGFTVIAPVEETEVQKL